MTTYINPSTRNGGTERIIVADRKSSTEVDEAPFDDKQYVRVNGEWVEVDTPEIVPDTTAPKPPTNLGYSANLNPVLGTVDYVMTWDAPVENTDGSALDDLAYYVVRWRYAGGSQWATSVATDTSYVRPGLVPGADVEWEVLARDFSGNDSTWAASTIEGAVDTTPPDQPSVPTASSRLGTIRVTWNGLDVDGDPPPADFDRLELYVSTVSGGPWTYIGQLAGAGSIVVTDVPLGETRYFSTVAIDTSGNTSVRSAETSVTAVGVTGDDIEAGSITANDIAAGAFTADFTLTGSLVAGDPNGARVEISDEGIVGYRSDGSVRASIPTDDSSSVVLEGDLVADSLTVRDQFALRGESNEVAKGSKLALSDGTSSPTSPPSIVPYYEKYDGGLTAYLMNQRGFHHEYDGSGFFAGMVFFQYSQLYAPGGRRWDVPTVHDADGNEHSEWNPWGGTTACWSSGYQQVMVTCGTKHVEGETDGGSVGFRVYDWTTMVDPAVDSSNTPPTLLLENYPAGIVGPSWTSDHRIGRCIGPFMSGRFVDVSVQYNTPFSTFRFQKYSATTLDPYDPELTIQLALAENEGLAGVAFGRGTAFGFPEGSNVYLLFTSVKCYVFDTDGTRRPEFDFPMSGSPRDVDTCGLSDSTTSLENETGFVGFRSTIAYQAEGDVRWITKYTNMTWGDAESPNWWGSVTWRDPDPDGSTHETAQSPLRQVQMPKRAALLVTVPPYPARPEPTTTDDVTAAGVYIGRGDTEPDRLEMQFAGQTDDPVRTLVIRDFPVGAPPPAFSDFPATAPALITSADGVLWYLSGDGAAHFDWLEGDLAVEGGLDVGDDVTVGGALGVTGGGTISGGLEVAGPVRVGGGLRVDTDPSDTYSNRIVDPELLDFPTGDLPFSEDSSVYTDQWSVRRWSYGINGAYAASIDDGQGRLGGRAIRMALSTAGAPVNEVDVKSPHFDLVPTATYLVGAWVRKTEGGVARSYLRLMGGVDDNLAEYDGRGSLTMSSETGCYWSDVDVSQGWTWAATVIKIPAGIVRGAVLMLNYRPASGSTHYWHGFKVLRLGPGFTDDTGTVRASALLNGWENYSAWSPDGTGYDPLHFRRIGPMVHVSGMVKGGSGDVFNLPYGFRPRNKRIEHAQVSGGVLARIDYNADGSLTPGANFASGWSALASTSYPAADAQ